VKTISIKRATVAFLGSLSLALAAGYAGARQTVKITFIRPLTGGVTRYCSVTAIATVDTCHKFGLPVIVRGAVFPSITYANKFAEIHRVNGTMINQNEAAAKFMTGMKYKILIDEPSLGLSPLLVKETFSVIRRINELGITVLLMEQNVHQTLAIAQYGYVLSQGRVVASGTAKELTENAEVRAAYFG